MDRILGLRRHVCSAICIALLAGGLSVSALGTAAHATTSPLVYGINPFGNEPGYFGLQPFQLSTGALVDGSVITVVAGPNAGDPVIGGNALAVDPTTSIAYAAIRFGTEFVSGNPRYLATIDLTNGQATTIAVLSRQIAGFAFHTDGTLFAVSGDGDQNCGACLYSVDKATADLTKLKELGTEGDDGEAIAFNPNDDMIYHVSGGPASVFETVDPGNAFAQTAIALSGGETPGQVFGIGFHTASGDFVMIDGNNRVWTVTPSGASTKLEETDTEMRGLVVGSDVTVLDFADAPDGVGLPPNDYPTLTTNGGASHDLIGPKLGARRDGETDGQPTAGADGDDEGNDDEDGITFLNHHERGLVTGVRVWINTGATGKLDGWVDFNHDGDWDDANEKVFNSLAGQGIFDLSYDVPASAALGVTFARFRVSTAGALEPGGAASDGEVEDYAVEIKDLPSGQRFRCGQRVGRRVKLNGDLLDCPLHGLVIKRSDTRINLNGHTIDGVGANNSRGINNEADKREIVVRGNGGTIRQFENGVFLDETKLSLVRGVELLDNTSAGISFNGPRNQALNNSVDGSRFGIFFQGNRNLISGNTIADSTDDGIAHLSGVRSKVNDNVITDSGENGIQLNVEQVTVRRNDVTNSTENGLIVNFGNDVDTIVGSENDPHGDPCLPARLCFV